MLTLICNIKIEFKERAQVLGSIESLVAMVEGCLLSGIFRRNFYQNSMETNQLKMSI